MGGVLSTVGGFLGDVVSSFTARPKTPKPPQLPPAPRIEFPEFSEVAPESAQIVKDLGLPPIERTGSLSTVRAGPTTTKERKRRTLVGLNV